jgi:hypothetical protein
VTQAGEHANLAREAFDAVVSELAQDLERHGLTGRAVEGAIDRPHSAGTGDALDLEAIGYQLPKPHRQFEGNTPSMWGMDTQVGSFLWVVRFGAYAHADSPSLRGGDGRLLVGCERAANRE